jgi:hypothetical protein
MTLSAGQLEDVVEIAALAPSVHNTQPWTFISVGHTLEVRADEERQLNVLDPSSRQLHISCGAAVEYARLAVRCLGFDCVVRLLPRPGLDPRTLATLTIGGPAAPTPIEQSLTEAIPRRYTDRGPYDDRPLPADLVERVRDLAGNTGAWVRVLDRPGERTVTATLLADAESELAREPGYLAELDTWTRPAAGPDGVPVAGTTWADDNRVTDVPLRDFTGVSWHRGPDAGPPPHIERDTLLLLGSDDDTTISWLRTGRSLAVALLTIAAKGLTAQPLGQITDVPATRTRLQHELGLLGHPQLLLRVGYGHGQPVAGRRSVDDLLRHAATT